MSWPTADRRRASDRLPVDRRLRVLRGVSTVLVSAYVLLTAAPALGLGGSTGLLVPGG
ncbi:hypothetical protein [Modestobacter sp. URMC 112]